MCKLKQIFDFVILVFTFATLGVMMSGCEKKGTANAEKIKTDIRRINDDAWMQGKIEVLDEYYDPNFVRHIPPFPDLKGLDAYKQYMAKVRSDYSDIQITLHEIIVEGNTSVVQRTFMCKHTGQDSYIPVPPTGKELIEKSCVVSHWENGKIIEEWAYIDILGDFQQLGYKMTPPITETTFARVTVTQIKPAKLSESVKIYSESVVPDAKKQKGFRGIFLLSDFKTGEGLSIAIWDSEADAIANEQSGYYKAQTDKFKNLFTAKPIREGYTVTVQE